LEQVISRTVEARNRGRQESTLRWSADWFRGENDRNLLVVSD
jgi:hypothetical protein